MVMNSEAGREVYMEPIEILKSRLEGRIERAQRRGVTVGLYVAKLTDDGRPGSEIMDSNARELFHAASINKLAIALAVQEIASRSRDVPRALFVPGSPSSDGAGELDRPGVADRAVPLSLLIDDMLRRSGNRAARAFMRARSPFGADAINEMLGEKGYVDTRLLDQKDGSGSNLGQTTPLEASSIVCDLMQYDRDRAFGAEVRYALTHGQVNRGSRVVTGGEVPDEVILGAKTGDWNGGDVDMPDVLRHEVMYLSGVRQPLVAAMFTRSQSAGAADVFRLRVASDMLDYNGIKVRPIAGHLAKRALRRR